MRPERADPSYKRYSYYDWYNYTLYIYKGEHICLNWTDSNLMDAFIQRVFMIMPDVETKLCS